jgi:eukaryotic-like serine/threonine-protein kinase
MSSSSHSSCPTTRPLQRHRQQLDGGDPLIGRFLDQKFRIVQRIGQGAYGCVYRAEQMALHRDVAIKVLDASATAEPDLAERFNREACAVSRVHHPNIVSIFDFGRTDDGLLFLAMEYIHGVTLTELVACAAPLPLAQAIDLIAQVAMALEAIHAAGLVHADLKSDNLLVQPLPRGQLVKVVDFGIARWLEPAGAGGEDSVGGAAADVTIDGDEVAIAPHVRGTPGYIAPEVIRGAAPTQAADVYAAGVVLHLLLTGELPFVGRHPGETLRRQLVAPVLPPSLTRPEVPEILDDLVLRATARDPGARYADATELRCAIEAAAMELAPGSLSYGASAHGLYDARTFEPAHRARTEDTGESLYHATSDASL